MTAQRRQDDTLREAVERLLEKWEAKSRKPTFDEFDRLVCDTYESRASDLRAVLVAHPAPEPGRCTCGLPGCSDEPDTVGEPACDCGAPVSAHGGEIVGPAAELAVIDHTAVYSCDSAGCPEEFVANSCDEILATVRLVGAGWSVHEADQGPIPGYRRLHYCPTHTWTWPVPDLAPEDGREALTFLFGEHTPVYDYHDGHFTMECEACDFILGGVDRATAKRCFGEHFAFLASDWLVAHDAALVDEAQAITRAKVAREIRRHAEHMEGYSLPAISPGFIDGYCHALRLLRRDADFIAARAATKAVS